MRKIGSCRPVAVAALASTLAAALITLTSSPAHASAQSAPEHCETLSGWQVCVSYNYDANTASANAQNLSNSTKTGHLFLYPVDNKWTVDKAYTWHAKEWWGHGKADSRRTKYCAQVTSGSTVVVNCWPFSGEPLSSK